MKIFRGGAPDAPGGAILFGPGIRAGSTAGSGPSFRGPMSKVH